jgi:filamentous hemagglutinin
MPVSDDPDSTARAYVSKIQNGQTPVWVRPEGEDGGFVAKMPDGAFITFRPAGQASSRTPASTASVDINDARLSELNAGKVLKLKFPKR